MTPTEAAALLTIAAAYDNRKPDADQAKAWAMALDGLGFEDCRQVVVEHYRKTRDWLMPADVFNGVRRLRYERIEVVKQDGNVSRVELSGSALKKDGSVGKNPASERLFGEGSWPEWLRSVVKGLA